MCVFSLSLFKSVIVDLGSCKVVFTADQAPYKKDFIPLKQRVDDALSDDALRDTGCVEKVFVFKRTGAEVKMNEGRDVWLEEVINYFQFNLFNSNNTYYYYYRMPTCFDDMAMLCIQFKQY